VILTEISFDKLITIRIHDEGTATDFIVPSTLIASRSEFFKNTLKQCWRQDDTQAINVYDYDPDVFALYLHILYGEPPHLEYGDRNYATFCQIYVLAEFVQDTRTKEVIMEYLWNELFEGDYTKRSPKTPPDANALHILYSSTTTDCPARRLIVDVFASVDYSRIIGNGDAWPEEFLRELTLALYKHVNFKGGRWSNTDNMLCRLSKSNYFEVL
jgi:hypothetical protein